MREILFRESIINRSGNIVITGLRVPRPTKERFDPLGEIWSYLRKKFRDYYEIDVVGTFDYLDAEKLISCNLYLNYGVLGESEDKEEYFDRFFNAFTLIAHEFEETIVKFISDEKYGLSPYREMAKANFSPVIYEGMFEAFMNTIK